MEVGRDRQTDRQRSAERRGEMARTDRTGEGRAVPRVARVPGSPLSGGRRFWRWALGLAGVCFLRSGSWLRPGWWTAPRPFPPPAPGIYPGPNAAVGAGEENALCPHPLCMWPSLPSGRRQVQTGTCSLCARRCHALVCLFIHTFVRSFFRFQWQPRETGTGVVWV